MPQPVIVGKPATSRPHSSPSLPNRDSLELLLKGAASNVLYNTLGGLQVLTSPVTAPLFAPTVNRMTKEGGRPIKGEPAKPIMIPVHDDVEQEVLDENNNPVLDDQGNPQTETVEKFIGYRRTETRWLKHHYIVPDGKENKTSNFYGFRAVPRNSEGNTTMERFMHYGWRTPSALAGKAISLAISAPAVFTAYKAAFNFVTPGDDFSFSKLGTLAAGVVATNVLSWGVEKLHRFTKESSYVEHTPTEQDLNTPLEIRAERKGDAPYIPEGIVKLFKRAA